MGGRAQQVDHGGAGRYRISPLKRTPLPIMAGSLRGMLWLPASGGKILRVMFGSYERRQTELFVRSVQPGEVVYDVGASVGYYTLLAAQRVGPRGRVVAFEPDLRNAAFLTAHVQANGFIDTVDVRQTAVGAVCGATRFARGTGTGTGHISAAGELEVPLCRLDDVTAEQPQPPKHVKIDVEGAELDVLNGAQRTLTDHRPQLFLSTHGRQIHDDCCRLLVDLGYQLEPITGERVETTGEILCRVA